MTTRAMTWLIPILAALLLSSPALAQRGGQRSETCSMVNGVLRCETSISIGGLGGTMVNVVEPSPESKVRRLILLLQQAHRYNEAGDLRRYLRTAFEIEGSLTEVAGLSSLTTVPRHTLDARDLAEDAAAIAVQLSAAWSSEVYQGQRAAYLAEGLQPGRPAIPDVSRANLALAIERQAVGAQTRPLIAPRLAPAVEACVRLLPTLVER